MMRIIQEGYREPSGLQRKVAAEASLAIHQRTEVSRNRTLIVLVHGLGGKRYGSSSTWRLLPKFLYEDFETCDIGLYSYRTLFRRLKFSRSRSLEAEAEILAHSIKNEGYQRVVLIGHSLGGLLCKAAIAFLVHTDPLVLEKIRGLILMATPQLGSLRVPGPFHWVSSDFFALQRHGSFIQRIDDTFSDHLYLDDELSAPRRYLIPTWAIRANRDFWVDKLSAKIGLPNSRVRTVAGSHTNFVKPPSKQADGYRYAKEFIEESLKRRPRAPKPTVEEVEQLQKIGFMHFFPEGLIEAVYNELSIRLSGSSESSPWIEKLDEDGVAIAIATKQAREMFEDIVDDESGLAFLTLSNCISYFQCEDPFSYDGEIGVARSRLLRDLLATTFHLNKHRRETENAVDQIAEKAHRHLPTVIEEGYYEIAASIAKALLDMEDSAPVSPCLLYARLLLKCGAAQRSMDIFDLYRGTNLYDNSELSERERVIFGLDWAKATKDSGSAIQRHRELVIEYDKMLAITQRWEDNDAAKSIRADVLNNRGTQKAVFGEEKEWESAESDITQAEHLYGHLGDNCHHISCAANFVSHALDRFSDPALFSELLARLTALDNIASNCTSSEELFFFYYQKARVLKRRGSADTSAALAFYEAALKSAIDNDLFHRAPIARRWVINLKRQLRHVDDDEYHQGLELCQTELSKQLEDTWCIQALRETYLDMARINETLMDESAVWYSLVEAFHSESIYFKRNSSMGSKKRLHEILRLLSKRRVVQDNIDAFIKRNEETLKEIIGSTVWSSLTWTAVTNWLKQQSD